ncbi:DUF998 domain-containing protein [Asanoa sp. WMMD1127]|uniref:DUF998 domain-containing protein n=1 Tax=Asanoa sp. WMMD1127 TaxID=3016107 RepID=UPI0024164A9F|nr:DUF998 domain-containing protein [Asanoa sp. WMMD1127]MDG4821991.1 DUF998 domain-containing protein [Asanoa sp. WMMD1127]
MTKTAAARAFGVVSILGLLTAVVATVVGHIGLGPGYDPLKLTISDYALSNRGVTIEIAMVALALGAPALLAGLRAVGVAIRGLPTVLLSIWSVGMLIAAIIPTDPPGMEVMSTAALIHRYASVAAFVVLPVAAVLIASRFAGLGRGLASTVRRLAVSCAVGVAVLWYVAFPGGRVMMGLVERGLVGIEIAILAVLSIGLLRATRTGKPASAEPAPVITTPTTTGAAAEPALASPRATAPNSEAAIASPKAGAAVPAGVGAEITAGPRRADAAGRALVGAVSSPAHRGSPRA